MYYTIVVLHSVCWWQVCCAAGYDQPSSYQPQCVCDGDQDAGHYVCQLPRPCCPLAQTKSVLFCCTAWPCTLKELCWACSREHNLCKYDLIKLSSVEVCSEWIVSGLGVTCQPQDRETGIALCFPLSSCTIDLEVGTLVATLPCAWHYRVSARAGWPIVSILRLGERAFDRQSQSSGGSMDQTHFACYRDIKQWRNYSCSQWFLWSFWVCAHKLNKCFSVCTVIIIIIMRVFLERFSMWNKLICAE